MTGMSHSIQGRPTIQHVLNMNVYCGAVESVLLKILCCCGVVLLQILSRCRLGFAVEAVLLQILFSRSLGFLPVICCFADASSL